MPVSTFGQYLKELRTKKRVTLREHCLKHEFDPGNYSRLERGFYPPPQKQELLEKYATALGIREGGDEWTEFFDLAAAFRGEIPKDLRDNEILAKLPILFRTLRGERVPQDKLDDLIEMIRKKG